jgi:serine/threonine protein kinase
VSLQLTINAGQYSEKGSKAANEDCCGILVPEEPLLTTKGIAVVIADGVSSSAGGRQASEACVQGLLSDYYSTPESWTVKTAGQRVLGALNRWLHGQGHQRFGCDHGMLTTLSGLIIKSATAHLFHVGDTRIYLLRDNQLECLTRDHQTWTTDKTAFLCRAMGADLNVDIDYRSLPIETGDIFLLSTDGIHGFINHKELHGLLTEHHNNPERCCRMITTRALENGSNDNVTCQLIQVEALPNEDEEEFYRHLTELPFPPSLDEGNIIDGYRILRELHASKRTQVYLALDTESNEKVVLKTPSVNFEDDPQYIDRFLHEEWAGRRINSPHVLKIIEPRRRRRFMYYVTEYLEGQTLRQWMNDHPLPSLKDVRPILEQISMGLRALHRLEMLHQDLKPENIMIDHHGTVKIVDFGSTRIAGIHELSAPIERENLLGTVDFAAPEYFIDQAPTNRSDIYSLGAIAYEMLTGKLPYGGPLSARTIKRIDYHPAREINPEVPRWVDGALQKAVCKNPEKRYPILSEFIYDINHPNATLLQQEFQPLLKRNPLAFWRVLSMILLVLNLFLLYFLLR